VKKKKFWDLDMHLQLAKSYPGFLAKALFYKEMLWTAETSSI